MSDIDLSVKIGDTTFKTPFLNAAGVHCVTHQQLDDLDQNPAVGGFCTKSTTLNPRAGNLRPRYYRFPNGSLHARKLPNQGFHYYLSYLLKKHQKPTVLSIAGMTPADDLQMLHILQDSSYQGVTELNLSNPNAFGRSQIAYDFKGMAILLQKSFSFYKKPLGIKLPPYLNLSSIDYCSILLNQFPLAYVNVINCLGNGLWVDIKKESTVLKPQQGFGRVGGHGILPIALSNVRRFRMTLKPEIKIIGTGGISSGADAFAHLLCGANLVSIGTVLEDQGPEVFQKLEQELKDLMKKKGYHKIADFQGKLKTL